jgi:DNA-binding NtrC family response regulator
VQLSRNLRPESTVFPGGGVETLSVTAEKPAGSLRILVVDDEPLIRWSAAETLTHAGHAVDEAGDAHSALRHASEGPPPDVILLDFRLPDSNDLKLLAALRDTLPRTAIVLMTAYGSPDVVAGALKLGAYRVIGKPFDMRDLEDLVRQAYEARPK